MYPHVQSHQILLAPGVCQQAFKLAGKNAEFLPGFGGSDAGGADGSKRLQALSDFGDFSQVRDVDTRRKGTPPGVRDDQVITFQPLHCLPDGSPSYPQPPGNLFIIKWFARLDLQDNKFVTQDPVGEVRI